MTTSAAIMLEWTLPECRGDTERMSFFFFIRKHFSKSLLLGSERGWAKGGGAEPPEGHEEIFCPQLSHRRAELLRQAAREAENFQTQSSIVSMSVYSNVCIC